MRAQTASRQALHESTQHKSHKKPHLEGVCRPRLQPGEPGSQLRASVGDSWVTALRMLQVNAGEGQCEAVASGIAGCCGSQRTHAGGG